MVATIIPHDRIISPLALEEACPPARQVGELTPNPNRRKSKTTVNTADEPESSMLVPTEVIELFDNCPNFVITVSPKIRYELFSLIITDIIMFLLFMLPDIISMNLDAI